MVHVVFTGIRELEAATRFMVANARRANREATQEVVAALIRQARINASNPPRRRDRGMRKTKFGTFMAHREGGPGVVTGALRRSITETEHGWVGVDGYRSSVAPTVVYARRLELGFVGPDSLGRVYNQPPYPYMVPAFNFVVTYVAPRAYRQAWERAIRRAAHY